MDTDINEKLLTNGEGQEGAPSEEKLKERLWSETKKMWVVAGPAIFTRFSTFGINVISQAFIGHIGATELAAYALVATVFLRFANGILVCLISLVCHLWPLLMSSNVRNMTRKSCFPEQLTVMVFREVAYSRRISKHGRLHLVSYETNLPKENR